MRIKYHNFQLGLILVMISIPMLIWSLGIFSSFREYVYEENRTQISNNVDQFVNQIHLNLENELNRFTYMVKLEEVGKIDRDTNLDVLYYNENQFRAFRKDYGITGEKGAVMEAEGKTVFLYITASDQESGFIMPIGLEALTDAELKLEIIANNPLNLDLGVFQWLGNEFYKAVYDPTFDMTFIVKGKGLSVYKEPFILEKILVILANLLVILIATYFLRQKEYPLYKLSAIFETLKRGQYSPEHDPINFNQTLSQLISEINDLENNLITQISELTESTLKYKSDIKNIEDKGKSLKREHDQYFTEMASKEGLNDILFETVNQVVFLINKDGIILEVNRTFENKLGFKKDEIVGQSILSILMENTRSIKELTSHNEEPLFLNFKMSSIDSNVSQFLNVKINELPNGTYLYIGKSINEEITLQSRILRKNRELEYINQINSALISNWGLNELLINIINRIDYLFNIIDGTIRVKNDEGFWEIKAQTDKGSIVHEAYIEDIDAFYNSDITSDSEIKIVGINEDYRKKYAYPENLKEILVAPMEVDGEIIAILSIGIENPLTTNDFNIMKMFKNQASVVVQRALLYDQLRKQYFNTIHALVNVIEAKDKYTEGHSRRVSRFSVEIAVEMGYSNEELENIEIAGLLHDVGKVGIHQSILTKQGKLNRDEYEIIKQHPEKGIQILKSIKLNAQIIEGILYHHVRHDLKGYPLNHNLQSLPEYAGIIGVADAFDAITSERSYSKAETIKDGLKELIRNRGTQFSPEIIDVFEKLATQSPERLQRIIDDL